MALTVLSSTAASANRNEVTIERDLSLKTRDGVILDEQYLETRFARRVVESWTTGLALNATSRRANSASEKVSWTAKAAAVVAAEGISSTSCFSLNECSIPKPMKDGPIGSKFPRKLKVRRHAVIAFTPMVGRIRRLSWNQRQDNMRGMPCIQVDRVIGHLGAAVVVERFSRVRVDVEAGKVAA